MKDVEMCEQFARLIGKHEIAPGTAITPNMLVKGANGNIMTLPVIKYMTAYPTVLSEIAKFCRQPIADNRFSVAYRVHYEPSPTMDFYRCEVYCHQINDIATFYWDDKVIITSSNYLESLMYAMTEMALRIEKRHA